MSLSANHRGLGVLIGNSTMNIHILRIVTGVFWFAGANLAFAATIYQYSGVITESYEVAGSDPFVSQDPSINYSRLFNGIEVGAAFSGEFIYDPSMYASNGDGYGSSFSIVVDGISQDTGYYASYFSVSRSGGEIDGIRFNVVIDVDHRLYENGSITFGTMTTRGVPNLPTELPDALLASEIMVNITGYEDGLYWGRSWSLVGSGTSFSVVPIPGAAWLFAAALVSLTGLKRGRR